MHQECDYKFRGSLPLYIHSCGFISALGDTPELVHERLRKGESPDMVLGGEFLNTDQETVVGKVLSVLPEITEAIWNSGNNRLALSALKQIAESVEQAVNRYGIYTLPSNQSN